jgi:hypothetical protein
MRAGSRPRPETAGFHHTPGLWPPQPSIQVIETRSPIGIHPGHRNAARARLACQRVPITVASTARDDGDQPDLPEPRRTAGRTRTAEPATFRASHSSPSILLNRHGPSDTARVDSTATGTATRSTRPSTRPRSTYAKRHCTKSDRSHPTSAPPRQTRRQAGQVAYVAAGRSLALRCIFPIRDD